MHGSDDRKQLGRNPLESRPATAEESDALEGCSSSRGVPLTSAVVQSGTFEEGDAPGAPSEQHRVPSIDLSQVVVATQNLKLVPYEVARQHLILPVAVREREIVLAMADPHDQRVIKEIEFVTGRTVRPYVAPPDQLAAVIEEAYRELGRGASHWVGPDASVERVTSYRAPTPAPRPQPPASGSSPPKARFPAIPPEPVASSTVHAGLFQRPTISPVTAGSLERDVPRLDPAFDSRLLPGPRQDASPVSRPSGQPPKVLVVDDEQDIRRMLRRVLHERGLVVLEASKGSEALQLVREQPPDVIVLDAMLPEVHGFDICRRIKSSPKYGHIPIVMVSAVYRGWRFAEDLQQSYGVHAFLEKPFKIADLVSAVDRALVGGTQERPGDEGEEISAEGLAALTAGLDAYKRDDIDGAIAHLRQGVASDPNAFRLHYHLGLLYGRKGQLFEAIQEMETAVELAPRHFAALKNLAVLYQRAGFKHRAMEIWERALGSAPDEETKRGIREYLRSLL